MTKPNINHLAWTIILPAIIIFSLIVIISQDINNLELWPTLKLIPLTITVNIVLWMVFIKWCWRWRIFNYWLVPFPDLTGTWQVSVSSTSDKSEKSILGEAIVKQSFLKIDITLETEESKSRTLTSTFDINVENGSKRLIYNYENVPRATIRDKSQIHFGTCVLDIADDQSALRGEYWNSRKSTGDIEFKRQH